MMRIEHISILRQLVKWSIIVIPISIAIGSTVAFFLWILNLAIHYRFEHIYLLYLLPVAGLVIHLLYQSIGKSSERGNNLIMDEIHQPGGGVPKRMAPIGTFRDSHYTSFRRFSRPRGDCSPDRGKYCPNVWKMVSPQSKRYEHCANGRNSRRFRGSIWNSCRRCYICVGDIGYR
ncbi:Chloride channel protein [Sphingobacterium faecium PCAi_F2.5]|nr:Chloride channel protein [Sphingobacterium faecium PCAi_F2.5]